MDREEKFKKICEGLDNLSDDEKRFALWLLLRDYGDKLDIPKEINTIEDFRKERFNRGLLVDCNELIDILSYELWR
jgi:hypothetical protein